MKDEKEIIDIDDKSEDVKDVMGSLLKSMDSFGGGNRELELFKLMMVQQNQFYQTLLKQQGEEIKNIREELRNKKDDSIENLSKTINSILDIAGQIKGKGGKSDIWDKVVDTLTPHVPRFMNTLGEVTGMGVNAIKSHTVPNSPPQPPPQPNPAAPFAPLFEELRGYIEVMDTSRFAYLSQRLLQLFQGDDSILKGFAVGEISPSQAIQLLQNYHEPFKERDLKEKLEKYLEAYLNYLRGGPYKAFFEEHQEAQAKSNQDQSSPYSDSSPKSEYLTHCNVCLTEVAYDSHKDYLEEPDHVCGMSLEGGLTCVGQLIEGPAPRPAGENKH